MTADPPEDLRVHLLDAETRALLENARKVPRVPKKIQKRQQHFIKVPWFWFEKLQKVKSAQTYRLALLLLYLHWRGSGGPVKLANGTPKAEGISRQSKWRALVELEQLGLIVIERRSRRSPVVRLLNLSHP